MIIHCVGCGKASSELQTEEERSRMPLCRECANGRADVRQYCHDYFRPVSAQRMIEQLARIERKLDDAIGHMQ